MTVYGKIFEQVKKSGICKNGSVLKGLSGRTGAFVPQKHQQRPVN
jgi:hypothetical protein